MNKGKDSGRRAMIIMGSEDFPDLNYFDDDDDIWMVVEQMSHVQQKGG